MRALQEPKISIVFFLLFFSTFIIFTQSTSEIKGKKESSEEVVMLPLMEEKFMIMNETRRKLGRYQICGLCTCCGGPKGLCLPSPCCYAITCNIPNRPYGYCSFTPKSCNCFSCHI